jgi:hypothetical protein
VFADAALKSGDLTGSIHKVSAAVLKKDSNNGWTFWYVMREGKLLCIDELRYEYEKKCRINPCE